MEEIQKNNREKINIIGFPVDRVTMEEAVEAFKELMHGEEEQMRLIVTPNSEILVSAEKNPVLGDIIRSADLVIPDGIGLVYASRLLGAPLTERVTGVDLLSRILEYLAGEKASVFLLGSKPASDGISSVSQLAGDKMQEAFPGLVIAGTHHGYFGERQEQDVISRINESGADFLCIALGSPKQEEFAWKYRDVLKPRVAIGVGGSLDVWAGTVKRAPLFYQKHGLEWLYRFAKQPSRYKRMAALPAFMAKVLVRGKKKRQEI